MLNTLVVDSESVFMRETFKSLDLDECISGAHVGQSLDVIVDQRLLCFLVLRDNLKVLEHSVPLASGFNVSEGLESGFLLDTMEGGRASEEHFIRSNITASLNSKVVTHVA